jgi:hypothetical protein
MGRRHLLLSTLLVPALTACALPGTPAARTADCEEALVKGLLEGPIDDLDIDNDELENRVHSVCEELVDAGLDDSSSEAELLAVLRENPALTGEICEISTEALYGDGFNLIAESFGGYVTPEQVMRMGRDGCLYALTEGDGSFTKGLDMRALFRAHPYLAAPFCRAPLMQAYDQEKPRRPRRSAYEEVVTEACMEAIRTGVVDYGMGNLLAPTVDQKRFRQLLRDEWARRG